jgi:hypothetical protein
MIFKLNVSILLVVLLFFSCTGIFESGPKPVLTVDQVEPGTKGMVKALAYIKENVVESQDFFNPKKMKFGWWEKLTKDDEYKLIIDYRKVTDVLASGDLEEGIHLLDSILLEIENGNLSSSKVAQFKFNELLGVAWLRLGEVKNCANKHGVNSCIVPIVGDGIYVLKEEPRKAISYFKKALKHRKNDPGIRWLINLAYMTIDQYPDSVPIDLLIAPDLLASDTALLPFKNRANQLGLAVNSHAGGAIMDDFNNDGFLDVVFSGMYLNNQLRFYLNDGKGGFKDNSKEAGIIGITGGLNMLQADYNNDGYIDILLLRGGWGTKTTAGLQPNSLLKNNGDGTFEDVTKKAGLLSFYPTQTATWADFNNDGWLDLFIGNESSSNHYPSELYLNNKNGTFSEISIESGLRFERLVKGVTAGDYNNDGLTDLFVSCMSDTNRLYMNKGIDVNGMPLFEDVTAKSGIDLILNSFPTWFWDYNNDGWEDLMVFSYEQRQSTSEVALSYLGEKVSSSIPSLFKNNGNGTFSRVTEQSKLVYPLTAMGCNFGDINNDGFLDMYVGTGAPAYKMVYPNRMFLNRKGNTFIDVTTTCRLGHVQKGHGIAFGDLDNDGDQDILAEMGGAFRGDAFQNAVFENPGNKNHWLTLVFNGIKSNRSGIGTRIKITVLEDGKNRDIYSTVNSGGSFGANSLQQEIGLGQADSVITIEVWWPASAIRQNFKHVEMNQFYLIEEGNDELEKLDRKTIIFPDSMKAQMNHYNHI